MQLYLKEDFKYQMKNGDMQDLLDLTYAFMNF